MYNDSRAFNYAVLTSIVLHGLLLFGFSQRDPAKRAAPLAPILARLVQPPVPAAAPAPVAPQLEPAKPQPRDKPAPRKSVAAPKPVAKAAPPAPVAEPAPVSTPAPAAPEAPAPAAPDAAPMIARVEPVPAPAAPSAETFDVGSLAQYRLQLISIARKYKRYPRVAMDNNWEGEVVVRMVIGANGMITALGVKTSSGHEVLDQQALEMFKKAKPLAQIPVSLRGKEFTLELRAIYNLKDQDSG
jgi:periplasmic protein TonB